MEYDVKKLLPHREPFLFIDEVLEVNEESIVAKWFVSPDEDFFKGHFPDFPITVSRNPLGCNDFYDVRRILYSMGLRTSLWGSFFLWTLLLRFTDSNFGPFHP